jgi:N-acetylglucosaminyldiphosphoundecaprenol N-acetyl-beta-D-mannosaminyltransferase
VNAFKPHVLLVGMGMPRQEAWLRANLDALDCGVALPMGAAFDYEAGAIPTPPRWMGQVGMEWLFRLIAEPRRLSSRYLIEPWSLIGPALADLAAGLRRVLAPAR